MPLKKKRHNAELLDDPRENTNLVIPEYQTRQLQPQKKDSLLASLNPKQKQIVTWVGLGLGLSAVAAAVFLTARWAIRKEVSKKEQGKSLGSDKHATWAKQIGNAFANNGWWGTDEVLLRNTLREIPSQEDFEDVVKSYAKIYKGRSLGADMTDELKQTEYDEMVAIIRAKPKKKKDVVPGKVILDPKGWAKRIYAALSYNWLGVFWGTDYEAIKAVYMEIPSIKAYKITKYEYFKKYGTQMVNDLGADGVSPQALYRKYIKKKPYSIYNNG